MGLDRVEASKDLEHIVDFLFLFGPGPVQPNLVLEVE